MAQVAADYFDSSARKTETYLGWGRATVQLGLHERQSKGSSVKAIIELEATRQRKRNSLS